MPFRILFSLTQRDAPVLLEVLACTLAEPIELFSPSLALAVCRILDFDPRSTASRVDPIFALGNDSFAVARRPPERI